MTKAYNEEPVKMKVVLTVASSLRWEGLAEHIEGYKTTYHKSIAQAANTTDVDSASNTESASDIDSTLVLTDACTLDQLAEALKNTAINTIVVFYQQAEHYLAEAVSQGASFDHAAEQWQRTINDLLQIQRKNRARLKLVNIEQALAAPQALCEQLALLHLISTHELADSVKQDVTLLAACQYVIQSPELVQLNNLLQASSLLLQPDNKILVDVEGIVGGFVAATTQSAQMLSELESFTAEKAALRSELTSTAEEKNTLNLQLQQIKEELDKNVLELARVEKSSKAEQLKLQQKIEYTQAAHELEKVEKNRLLFDLVTRTGERDALHTKQEEFIVQLNESKEDNALLLMQLHQVQEELEKNFIEKTSFEATIKDEQIKQQQIVEKFESVSKKEKVDKDKLVANLAVKTSECDALLTKQEKITAQLNESEEENALLLMQLHHVQEELERIFLDKKRALVQEKQYQREITKLEHKLRNTTADLASKNYRLSLVVQDVDEMKRSVFWKTGAPVRAVSNAFNKSKKRRQKIQNEVELILSSEFFDTEWYLAQYPDVAESSISPAEHYLRFGAQEERFPGPVFNGTWYVETYPDVAESGINPLLHYIKFGKAEGRTASVKLLQDLSNREGL